MKMKAKAELIACGRDEMNLVEIPFTLLIKRQKDMKEKPKTIKGKDFVITGSDEWGLPLFAAEEVYLGLLAYSRINDFANRKVHFSQGGLIDLIGWPHCGISYKRLETALNQLSGVRIYFNRFWDHALKRQVKLNFGIITSFKLVSEKGRPRQINLPLSWFEWSNELFENMHAGFVKTIDIERYCRYKHPTTKRLFRYLDKHFYSHNELRRDIFNLAHDILGMQFNYQYASKLKDKLRPYFEELIEDQYIEEPTFEENRILLRKRGAKTSTSEEELVYWIKAFAQRIRNGEVQTIIVGNQQYAIERLLTENPDPLSWHVLYYHYEHGYPYKMVAFLKDFFS